MRICTWNIQLGRRLQAVLDVVRTNQDFRGLDLLALQQASIHGGREDAAAIAEALGAEYAWFQATAQMLRGRDQGNALIWRPNHKDLRRGQVERAQARCRIRDVRRG